MSKGGLWPGNRKQRTREHVLADLSANFLERTILRRGHKFDRPSEVEYGTDGIMLHFAENGSLENGEVRFQLKATDNLKLTHKKQYASVVVDEGNLHHWANDVAHPFILVIYDAARNRAYWLDVQAYVHTNYIVPKGDTVTLLVPVKNKLTLYSIDYFRKLSLERSDWIFKMKFSS